MRALHRVRVMFLMMVVSLTALSAACGDNSEDSTSTSPSTPPSTALSTPTSTPLSIPPSISNSPRRRARSTSAGTRTVVASERGLCGSRSPTWAPCRVSINRRTRSSPTSRWEHGLAASLSRAMPCGLPTTEMGRSRGSTRPPTSSSPRSRLARGRGRDRGFREHLGKCRPRERRQAHRPGDQSGHITISDVPDPAQLAAAPDAIWVTSRGGDVVSRISPTTDTVVASVDVGYPTLGLAATDEAVWVAATDGPKISRIDPATNRVTAQLDAGDDSWALAPDATGVWLTSNGANTVSKISAATNEVIETMDVGPRPIGLAVEDDAVWIANSGDNTVWRISTD